MIEEHIHFNSDGLKLEGVLSYDENVINPPSMLLCSPHPHLGGDMENNVITALGKVLAEKGYQETLKYKKQFGVANAPAKYKTPDGFYLGMWQSNKRTNYNKGRLNDERIKRLEKIGFVWVMRKP